MKYLEQMNDASDRLMGAYFGTVMRLWKGTLPISKAVAPVPQELTDIGALNGRAAHKEEPSAQLKSRYAVA